MWRRTANTGIYFSMGETSLLDWQTESSFEILEEEESWTLKSSTEQILGLGEREIEIEIERESNLTERERESMGFRVNI